MASKKISDLPPLSDLDRNNDLLMLIDTSDTQLSPSGTNKKAKVSDLVPYFFHLNLANDNEVVDDVSYSFYPPFNASLTTVNLSLASHTSQELRLHIDYTPSQRFSLFIPPFTDHLVQYMDIPFSTEHKVLISLISPSSDAKGLKMDMVFR